MIHSGISPICIYAVAFMLPNGMRYLRVGGRRERRFAGISLEPRELPKNAATPTRRVHAVLGRLCANQDANQKELPHGCG